MHSIIGVAPHDIMHGMPEAIMADMALQRSAIASMPDASMGVSRHVMPSFVISRLIRHIIGDAIIGMPPIIGDIMPGIMPPIIGMGIMPGMFMPMPPIIGIPMPLIIIGMGTGIIIGIGAGAADIPLIIGIGIAIAFIGVISGLLRAGGRAARAYA